MVKFKMTGASDLQRALDKLPADVARKHGTTALRAGARVILKEAKRQAPRKTGLLRKSLTVFARRTRGRIAEITVQIGTRFGKQWAWYAHLVEFGRRGVAPNPFLRRSIDSKSSEAVRTIGRRLFQLIAGGLRR